MKVPHLPAEGFCVEIIDNINRRLGDDLKDVIRPGSKLRIAAATFSIYAFEALQRELAQIESLEFVFTAPTFVAAEATDRVRRERREFFIPQTRRESSLYGSEFEIRLRKKLTQRAIARECAEWIERKVTFKSNRTGAPMQQFAIVDDVATYLPLNGFTAADLGYERGNAVVSLVNKFDEAPSTTAYLTNFEQLWHNREQLEDVTQLVHDHISSVYAENSPERVYFLILYNLFSEFLDEINEDVLPNDRTGYQDTRVWQSLYNFQRDAAVGIIRVTVLGDAAEWLRLPLSGVGHRILRRRWPRRSLVVGTTPSPMIRARRTHRSSRRSGRRGSQHRSLDQPCTCATSLVRCEPLDRYGPQR